MNKNFKTFEENMIFFFLNCWILNTPLCYDSGGSPTIATQWSSENSMKKMEKIGNFFGENDLGN